MSCQYCGAHHGKICPWVKAIEYYPLETNFPNGGLAGFSGGGVKRVEFWSRAELDAMAKAANPALLIGTGTGSIPICTRCGGGHYVTTCPETVADNRRAPDWS